MKKLIILYLMFLCTPSVKAQEPTDNFELEIKGRDTSHAFASNRAVELITDVKNISKTSLLNAELSICVQSYSGQELKTFATAVKEILANSTFQYTFSLDIKDKGFYIAEITLKDSLKQQIIAKTHGFSVNPEQVISQYPKPKDFKYFWVKTLDELAQVPPNYVLTERTDLGNDSMGVYSVEFRSLDNVRVQGWYIYPKNKKNLRAVVFTQGYTTDNAFSKGYLSITDYAQFLINIRGHGSSKKDVNPGFPAYLEYGLNSPYTYIFRGAYMDCIRSVDFLCSRPEIDCNRIGVWGASMGGALALATAALDRRIKWCVFDLPFLSDFRNYFEIGSWPSFQMRNYASRNGKSMEDIYKVLDYVDIKNLAPWVQCPVMMGVGLLDMTCPPAINFAAFNNLKVKNKQFFLFPEFGHNMPEWYYKHVRASFLDKL